MQSWTTKLYKRRISFLATTEPPSAAAQYRAFLSGKCPPPRDRYSAFSHADTDRFRETLESLRDGQVDLYCCAACREHPDLCHARVLRDIAACYHRSGVAVATIERVVEEAVQTRNQRADRLRSRGYNSTTQGPPPADANERTARAARLAAQRR